MVPFRMLGLFQLMISHGHEGGIDQYTLGTSSFACDETRHTHTNVHARTHTQIHVYNVGR